MGGGRRGGNRKAAWGRLLVRDLLSMGKMIRPTGVAVAARRVALMAPRNIVHNLSFSHSVLILTIPIDVFFLPSAAFYLSGNSPPSPITITGARIKAKTVSSSSRTSAGVHAERYKFSGCKCYAVLAVRSEQSDIGRSKGNAKSRFRPYRSNVSISGDPTWCYFYRFGCHEGHPANRY